MLWERDEVEMSCGCVQPDINDHTNNRILGEPSKQVLTKTESLLCMNERILNHCDCFRIKNCCVVQQPLYVPDCTYT